MDGIPLEPQYVITYSINFEDFYQIISAESDEDALRQFAVEKILTNEFFHNYVYGFSQDDISGYFFEFVPAGQHNDIRKINQLKQAIQKYFAGQTDYAERYFSYFMAWYPVEMDNETEEGIRVRNEITAKMRDIRFPKEMEIFIAMKESFEWCRAIVQPFNGDAEIIDLRDKQS